MKNRHADEMDKLLENLKAGRVRIIQGSAGKALAFFKNSFRNQGFTDKSLVKWPARKGGSRNTGRNVLIDKGVLRRGIRIMRANSRGALISVDEAIKYAEIQNEGGEIPITPKMRRYFWAMYYKAGGGVKGMKPDDVPNLAKMWLSMAITKETKIKIPKRQFIGDSATLERQLVTYMEKEITKLLNI